MDSENSFWIALWGIMAFCFVVLVVAITFHSIETNRIVAASADPIATACATGNVLQASPACLSLFSAKVQR